MEKSINAQVNVSGPYTKKEKLISFVNPEVKPAEISPEFSVASLDIETGKNNLLYSLQFT